MSQTIVPPGPAPAPVAGSPAPVPASTAVGDRVASGVGALRAQFQGSPGRLRVLAVVTVIAALLVGFGGGFALRERSAALDDASSASAHLVLLQQVQTGLVQADANATNSFLAFGLDPAGQRQAYIDAIADASANLAKAARRSPADAAALGAANAALTRYTGYISAARANNLQKLPVGASYLQTANDTLTNDVIPVLEKRTAADQAAIDSAYGRAARAAWWLALVVVVGFGALIWAQVRLARQTHRRLNAPLAGASAALLVMVLVAAGVMAAAQSRANGVRDGPLADVTTLSASRVAAFDAKSRESLTLINRGSEPTNEPKWQAAFDQAKGLLPRDTGSAASALTAYQAKHKAIRALDNAGRWDDARKQAISVAANSANGEFSAYAKDSGGLLTSQSASVTAGLGDAGRLLFPTGILLVVVGLVAAAGAWWGISLRLDEYR